MHNFLRQIAHSSAMAYIRTKTNDIAPKRQTIDIATSEVAINRAKVLCGIERFNGTVSSVIVEIELLEGSVSLKFADGKTYWSFHPNDFYSGNLGQGAVGILALASAFLDILNDIVSEIPWQHFSCTSLNTLQAEELRIIENTVPEVFTKAQPLQDKFGGGILALARGITRAREWECHQANIAAAAARLKKQFDRVPAGTILVNRSFDHSIAIVSDTRGSRTKRSLTIRRTGQQEHQIDMEKVWREDYCFLTPQKAKKLDPGLLSQHQVILALRQAKDLVSKFPDIA